METTIVTEFATFNGPAELALYPVVIVAFCVISAALIRMIPNSSALKYGVVTTDPPRYTISILFVPLVGGAVVKII